MFTPSLTKLKFQCGILFIQFPLSNSCLISEYSFHNQHWYQPISIYTYFIIIPFLSVYKCKKNPSKSLVNKNLNTPSLFSMIFFYLSIRDFIPKTAHTAQNSSPIGAIWPKTVSTGDLQKGNAVSVDSLSIIKTHGIIFFLKHLKSVRTKIKRQDNPLRGEV